ncbi:carboxylesterase family protein [Actinotalea sp. M2MS4P-6]|uniref:subtype A tannase n=1 Tax=Actinotalea sp. M2MS4P-6 TaxID=2983762 RepID=UPI0021E4A36C|nr:subtype A tannase [Actinotalea sp. M2MS4P-6]MCV2394361.1 carboxylesterase family protein [Actinotalea sp. M2MS4P-6]
MAALALGTVSLAACTADDSADSTSSSADADASGLALDPGAWQYDETNDVYYQLGNVYVSSPASEDYETLGIYVPGAYLDATDNGDGTYTATIDDSGEVAGYTASTAPIVFPVNTPGYSAQNPPTSYSYDEVASYLEAGFIYVAAGLRGRDSNGDDYTGNAPWGVTDLKAAVRYVRYNAAQLPGDADSVFVFGHSGGGAQSAVMGASGDSELYTPYLESIGAAITDANGEAISDAIAGVMAWCPITSLDYANEAYEWNMGQFATTGTRASGTWTDAYSQDLATAYAQYVDQLGLTDDSGAVLTLDESSDGVYLAGSYYDYLVSMITDSLNDFLSVTEFPYTPSSQQMAGMDTGGAPSGDAPSGMPTDGTAPTGDAPSDATADATTAGATSGAAPDDAAGTTSSGSSDATTYETVDDYIAALNADTSWVSYDASSNTATVTSLEGFVTSQKNASKDVGAFDAIDASATENLVLGLGEEGLHFDAASEAVIAANEDEYSTYADWDDSYGSAQYTSDFAETDSLGTDVATRLAMYNPMYYLSDSYDGYQTSTVAPSWRIRTGIQQGDTASTVEMNLALALQSDGADVDFATIWGQGHTMAELTGDGTTNFIAWVAEVTQGS